jgi:hypothetical protein
LFRLPLVLPKTEGTMSDADKRRRALEQAAAARKHVERRGVIGFNYRPTPPSGPSPEPKGSSAEHPKDKRQS